MIIIACVVFTGVLASIGLGILTGRIIYEMSTRWEDDDGPED